MNRSYKVEVIENDSGIRFETKNDGYNALELLGLYAYKMDDLIRQIRKEEKPEIAFKRTLVEEAPPKYTEPPDREWLDTEPHERSMTGD